MVLILGFIYVFLEQKFQVYCSFWPRGQNLNRKTIPPIESPFNFEKKITGAVLIKPVVFSEIVDEVEKT